MFDALRGRTPRLLDRANPRRYAVVAPYLPESESLLFQVRAPHLNRQPGEISFPGGGVEPGETPEQAAVRETAEELLVVPEKVELIAPLDVFPPSDGSFVHPFVARLHGYAGSYSRQEVQEVFMVPFAFFMNNPPLVYYSKVTVTPEEPQAVYKLLGVEDYPWMQSRYPMLFYQYQGRVIWGMTARFVDNLVTLIKEASSGDGAGEEEG